MDYRTSAPKPIKDFLQYHEDIQEHSIKTVDEYYLDLRLFFRWLKQHRGDADAALDIKEVDISDLDLNYIAAVTKTEVYDYLSYLRRDKVHNDSAKTIKKGLNERSRSRKLATLMSFFKYLTVKTEQLDKNPLLGIETPRHKEQVPKYLTLKQSVDLLHNVEGRHKIRDYAILTIFLNCGLRISELCGLNLTDIEADRLRIRGKGNKERIVPINDAVAEAINRYIPERANYGAEQSALFVSQKRSRISKEAVHLLVKKHLGDATLHGYSAHKLRHTCATLMVGNGVDIKAIQQLLGHEHLGTTEVYLHISGPDMRLAVDANPLKREKLRN
ncbi:MAG: tyrosine-type recombinase/integrase [Oscillospiraceae bacterium]|jgi:site-specific recombinase XerD|nr:tyrosine-type recombinase/integrase [Oscillospiraceae bacterium]